jgi:UDP-glucose 4-epimerase
MYKAVSVNALSRVFNLGSGIGHSLNEILEVIRKVTGRKIKVTYKAKRSFDIPSIYLDICRAKQELSWAPSVSLETGIEKTWKFVEKLYR